MSLDDAFRNQAETCARMGSTFTAKVLTVLADNWDTDSALGQSFACYTGDLGPAGHSLPLRLAGGLHALVLSGRDAGLKQVYPPYSTSVGLEAAISAALVIHEAFLLDWTQSPPQTNEVRRSAALIAMAHVARSHFDLPFHVSELGASGGLNLYWDHYGLRAGGAYFGPKKPVFTLEPDWDGPVPPTANPVVASRGGVDLNPLDPTTDEGLLRMSSYLWADQPERLARTRAAASIVDGKVDQGDAIEWLEQRLNAAPEGRLHFIQNTVAWQYFPKALQAKGVSLIEAAGRKVTADAPLAWAQMETDGDAQGKIGAALTLRLWPGDVTFHLGRADFHGRWMKWVGA